MTSAVKQRPTRSGAMAGLARFIRKATTGNTATGDVLIITSRHRLWQRYGPDGVFAVERAVGEVVDAMSARGMRSTFTYSDDSPLLTRFGVIPAETGDPASVARVIRDLSQRLDWAGQNPRYVLLLGDDGIVPAHRPDNPAPEDGDELLSDHPYGTDASGGLVPARAVGRIPDAGLEPMLAALRHSAAAHRRLAAGADLLLEPKGFGYSASIWKRAARGVFATVGQPEALRLSPPLSHRELPEPGRRGPRFRYFNLHGLHDSPHWFGQRDPSFPADYPLFPVAMRPVDLAPSPGCVVFSEACYGAHIKGRSVRDSVALTYLAGGALAFVGATGVAYGGLDGPLVAADLLAQRFWQATLAGAPAGAALAYAKRSLVEEALSRQGYLDAEDEKAVLNFVLYGDPSLIHHVPSVWAEVASVESRSRGAVERAEPAERVGTLPVRPLNKSADLPGGEEDRLVEVVGPRHGGMLPHGTLEMVREAVAKRLPEFADGDVTMRTAAAPRRAMAKSAAMGPRAPVVVTLNKSLVTGCGTPCRETVRVTVDSGGRIRKVVVSR